MVEPGGNDDNHRSDTTGRTASENSTKGDHASVAVETGDSAQTAKGRRGGLGRRIQNIAQTMLFLVGFLIAGTGLGAATSQESMAGAVNVILQTCGIMFFGPAWANTLPIIRWGVLVMAIAGGVFLIKSFNPNDHPGKAWQWGILVVLGVMMGFDWTGFWSTVSQFVGSGGDVPQAMTCGLGGGGGGGSGDSSGALLLIALSPAHPATVWAHVRSRVGALGDRLRTLTTTSE